jgi:hypothetical protein
VIFRDVAKTHQHNSNPNNFEQIQELRFRSSCKTEFEHVLTRKSEDVDMAGIPRGFQKKRENRTTYVGLVEVFHPWDERA